MNLKSKFLFLGWITLIIFPSIGYVLLWYFEEASLLDILALDEIISPITLLGLQLGLFYGFIVLLVSKFSVFQESTISQAKLIKKLNLSWGNIVFMAFAAGFGEEVLFRVSLQTWLGPFLTTFIFIAIHGYFHPFSLRKSAPGLLLFPFILIIAYGYIEFGLWFCVAAHFAYDLLMFAGATLQKTAT